MKKNKTTEQDAPTSFPFPQSQNLQVIVGDYLKIEAASDGLVHVWVLSEVSLTWTSAPLYPATARRLAGIFRKLAKTAETLKAEAAK